MALGIVCPRTEEEKTGSEGLPKVDLILLDMFQEIILKLDEELYVQYTAVPILSMCSFL